MGSAILRVERLTVGYGSFSALKSVSLTVEEGEIVAIVGPNGAGKSTLLQSVAGVLKPVEGAIEFRGEDIRHLGPHRRRKRGLILIPQEENLFPRMRVIENLQLAGSFSNRGSARNSFEDVYRVLPWLEGRRRQIAGTLSGGEQRMLALGMGMAANVRLLMIDELSLGLAPKVVSNLLGTLRTLGGETGISILLSEQSIKALDVADRVYGLEAGEIRFVEESARLDHDLIRSLYLGV
jgi:branched-chain amino acid transport system ATP-binding protein